MSKKFFDVSLEILNKEVPIIGKNIEDLNNRVILLDLTRELKGKLAEAKFKVEIKDNKPIGKIIYYGLIQNYSRRLVRKGTSPVEDSFVAKSKDGFNIRIKPLLVTRKKVVRNVRKKLRNKARELLMKFINENNRVDIFESIINYKIQKDIFKELKKIYPLIVCDIRRVYIEKEKI
ncbi:MAG: hypothetical protein QXQ30_01700 [Candidatus Pacearchaeota archaeon]